MINILDAEKKISIPYGSTPLSLTFPRGTSELRPDEPAGKLTPRQLAAKLEACLSEAAPDLSRPVLVVADKTRLCSYPDYLPVVTETINRVRGTAQPFPVIIAYGTHPRHSEEESLRSYGPLYRDWNFIHHDCDDLSLFNQVGTSAAGTPVRVRKDLRDASTIITMGPICHHYFAGYGGGRKLIFPGCGERQAIYRNHALFLDKNDDTLAAACRPGNLDNNPVAEDLFDIESFLPANIALHGIQDSQGSIVDFIVGSDRETYLEACSRHARSYEIDAPLYDTVVASCGGSPKDINFIQAHKAVHNSASFVRHGGQLLLFAECPDGIGSDTLLPWFTMGSFTQTFQKMRRQYEGNGGTALAMMTKTKRINIGLVTSLSDHNCQALAVHKWKLEELQSYLKSEQGSTAWIANASLLVKK